MLKLKKIGITGIPASGKTLVGSFFKECGACVISADEIVHQLLASDKACIQKVELLMGQDVKQGEQIDRKKVAQIAFSNKGILAQLEKILHPLAFEKMQKEYERACEKRSCKFFVVEAPLLYEADWQGFFDTVILVKASEDLCKSRYLAKGFTDFEKRNQRLIPQEEKCKLADFVIENNKKAENLRDQVLNIINKL